MTRSAVVVLMTAPNGRVSGRLAKVLVTERWAACVTVLGGARSLFRWKGKVECAREHLLFAKTTRNQLPGLMKRVEALHPYTVPEIIVFPLIGGNPSFLSWLSKSVSPLRGKE